MWKENVSINLKSFSIWHIDVYVDNFDVRKNWRFIGFYGSPYARDKKDTWDLLWWLGQIRDVPWLVSSDLNEILFACEKVGCLPINERIMEAFRKVFSECQLSNMGYSGMWYTWERGNLLETNVRERLDRGVAFDKWMTLFPNALIQHLPHSFFKSLSPTYLYQSGWYGTSK